MKKMMRALAALLAMLLSGTAGSTCNPDMTITKPDSIYTNHGNGAVTDNQTGLMWMHCSWGLSGTGCATGNAASYTWKQALEVAQAANSGLGTFGYTDWRLPNVVELLSLVEHACYSPAINTTIFPATVSNRYWSSSPYAVYYSGSAWNVFFYDGYENARDGFNNYYVRLVRGGL